MTIFVDWSIEPDELREAFAGYTELAGAHLLKTDLEVYQEMSEEERFDKLEWMIRHNILSAAEIVGVSDTVDVPVETMDPDDITEWLSDTYGYFVNGWTTY